MRIIRLISKYNCNVNVFLVRESSDYGTPKAGDGGEEDNEVVEEAEGVGEGDEEEHAEATDEGLRHGEPRVVANGPSEHSINVHKLQKRD